MPSSTAVMEKILFSKGDNKYDNCILHCFINSRGKLVGCRGNVQKQLAKTSQGSPCVSKFEAFPSGLKLHLFCSKAFEEDLYLHKPREHHALLESYISIRCTQNG